MEIRRGVLKFTALEILFSSSDAIGQCIFVLNFTVSNCEKLPSIHFNFLSFIAGKFVNHSLKALHIQLIIILHFSAKQLYHYIKILKASII